MESNTFSWERVWALLVRYWAEQRGKLMVVMSVAAVLMIAGFSTAGRNGLIAPAFFGILSVVSKVGFSFCLLYHIHLGFAIVKERKFAFRFLLVPANNSEKFVYLLLSSVFIPAVFYVSLFIAIAISFQVLFQIEFMSFLEYAFIFAKNNGPTDMEQLLILYSMLTALILGQFIFKKNTTAKTLLIVLFGSMLLSGLEQLVLNLFYQDSLSSIHTEAFGGLFLRQDQGTLNYIDHGLFDKVPKYLVHTFSYLFVTALGYVSYLKFKEKEAKI